MATLSRMLPISTSSATSAMWTDKIAPVLSRLNPDRIIEVARVWPVDGDALHLRTLP